VEETVALGRAIGASAIAGTVIALVGDLGAGKTAFTQGLGAGLGVQSQVQSPTFIVVQEHEGGRLPLFHADLYRVETEAALQQVGLDEMIEDDGVCVIEWADLHPDLLPEDHLLVRISHVAPEDGGGRSLVFVAGGDMHAALLERALG
jgi:tRNA threonylcarbamoyladenosine biosynthesis protein TsaE